MTDMQSNEEPCLENLTELTMEKVNSYESFDLMQQFAMFMGKSQILEIVLKNVLARRYQYDLEKLERHTLGRLKVELEKCSVRPDFLAHLESLTELRNFVAHELLAAEMLLQEALGKTGRLNVKHLHKAIFELEQLLLIVEWQEQHDAWGR